MPQLTTLYNYYLTGDEVLRCNAYLRRLQLLRLNPPPFSGSILPQGHEPMPYDPTIPEKELKNRVARDVFGAFDCARIFGKVDFCVSPHVEGPFQRRILDGRGVADV